MATINDKMYKDPSLTINFTLMPHISVIHSYKVFINEVSFISTDDNDSYPKATLKKVAKFVTLWIALRYLSGLSIFYNSVCFIMKGNLAILTHLLNKNLFNHSTNDYKTDMNLHLAFAIKDLAYHLFYGIIVTNYAFNTPFTNTVDNSVNSTIAKLCQL